MFDGTLDGQSGIISMDQRRGREKEGPGALNFTVISHYVFRARCLDAFLSLRYLYEERSDVGLHFGFRPSSLRNDEVHLDRVNAGVLCSSGSLQLSDSLIFLLFPLLLLVLLPPLS